MTEPYIEDDGAEFPINNCVQCGQSDYVPSFGEDRIKINKIKSAVPRTRGPKSKFMPKLGAPSKK